MGNEARRGAEIEAQTETEIGAEIGAAKGAQKGEISGVRRGASGARALSAKAETTKAETTKAEMGTGRAGVAETEEAGAAGAVDEARRETERRGTGVAAEAGGVAKTVPVAVTHTPPPRSARTPVGQKTPTGQPTSAQAQSATRRLLSAKERLLAMTQMGIQKKIQKVQTD